MEEWSVLLRAAASLEDSRPLKRVLKMKIESTTEKANYLAAAFVDACIHGSFEAVNALAEEGVLTLSAGQKTENDVQSRGLYLAAASGNSEVVRTLLSLGVNVNSRYDGETALAVAVRNCHMMVVQVLCEHSSCSLDALGYRKVSALHEACHLRFQPGVTAVIVDLLISKAHQTDLLRQDDCGWSPLHYAARSANSHAILKLLEVIGLFEARSGDLHDQPTQHKADAVNNEIVEPIIDTTRSEQVVTSAPSSPLVLAIMSGSIEAVDAILSLSPSSAHGCSAKSETPLMLAVKLKDRESSCKMLEHLQNYQTFHIDVDAIDREGATALHFAGERLHCKAISLLIEAGANPSLRNDGGYTALDLAERRGKSFKRDGEHEEAVRLLKCCRRCGKSGAETLCFRCTLERYCCVECQRRDWSRHKKTCSFPVQEV
eukprot:GHVT01054156.1.p1 GENE.GHVT01054156.1~~GHVT01054156.1.p1  ORF type:complete len:431 (-),score=38.20 GHVT01054156.1:13644-14936(-)